ncbi:MAG: TonB family protein [Sphingobacteriaceae bacterium]|nr:MAG: TonB family protein [Sphingobacteriaceae bacterium]
MKLKFYYAVFIGCFWVMNAIAQKKQTVYFLKDNGTYVNNKDSADFVRIMREPDSGSVLYNVVEYYPNGNMKMSGKSSSVDPLRLEGRTISYYPDQNKKQVSNYEKGAQTGEVYDYYPNGKLYREKTISVDYDKPWFERELIHTIYDSTGTATVKNGNGHYAVYDDAFKFIGEEGNIKSGKRDGTWKGRTDKIKLTYTEDYKDGKFLKGTSTDETGKTYNYTAQEVLPQFPGGDAGFGRFLSKNIRYPKNAKRNNLQGRIILSFVIQNDGNVTDIKILRSFDAECSAEASRVLSQSPRWNPGIQHGIPVKVAYTMPISFNLPGG